MDVYVECPRCGQGRINAYRFTSSGEVVHICDECDALWMGEVIAGKASNLETFLHQRGVAFDGETFHDLD